MNYNDLKKLDLGDYLVGSNCSYDVLGKVYTLKFNISEDELNRIIEAKTKCCDYSLDLANEEKEKEYLDAYDDGYEDGVNDAVGIKSILVNEVARIVTVKFLDGDVRIIRCSELDEFDYNIGVSLAISEHIFGSKTQRSKLIKNNARFIKVPELEESNKFPRFCFSLDKSGYDPFSTSQSATLPVVKTELCDGEIVDDEFITTSGKHYPLKNTLNESEYSNRSKIAKIEQRLLKEVETK